MCTSTYVMSLLIMLAEPFISLRSVSNSGKPSGKRERFGLSLDVSHNKMWTDFQHC